tara:strand:+ start:232 stop:771 length:540 start_codon:yes stop_codon:yes gene_type:complete
MLTVSEENAKFDWKNINLVDCLEGNAMDTYFTLKIYSVLLKELEDRKLVKLYEHLLSPLASLFSRIECEGLLICPKELEQLDKDLTKKMESTLIKLKAYSGVEEEDNMASTADLIKILFSLQKKDKSKDAEFELVEQGYGMFPLKMTDKDKPSTDVESLSKLKGLLNEEISKRKLNEQI